jgi:hypothetical protein
VRGSKQQPKTGSGGAIRQLFRQAVKVLTGRDDDAPKPKKSSRRKGDDSARRFTKTANCLTRLRERSFTALPWLADTLDWLNLWQPGPVDGCAADFSHNPPSNDLSLRL